MGSFLSPRPVRVLHLLRDRARADVLPHRRLGVREPGLRGHEVLPVHDARLGVHARRADRHRRDRQQGSRLHHLRPRRDRRGRQLRGVDRTMAVLRVRHRLRREGAAVPAAHLAPRRPHPGADGRLGRARRRDAQARYVRPPALRPVPVPRGVVLEPPALADPRGDRHHLRRHRGHDADRPQTTRRLLVGRAPRLHRARHVCVHDPVDVRCACSRWSTTACRPARCSCSSA